MSLFSSLPHVASAPVPALLVCHEQGQPRVAQEAEGMAAAQRVMAPKIAGPDFLTSPAEMKDFLRVRMDTLPDEVFFFSAVHLDAKHAVIEFVEMFRGSKSEASVYSREIVFDALRLNSSSVVLVHNQPLDGTPSRADKVLTQAIKQALSLLDVRVLDHLIVAGGTVVSMAEQGLV